MAERCRVCRFWQLDLPVNEIDPGEDQDAGFGWCRREPPKIIDHMARMAIPQPGFGGHVFDHDQVATSSNVHSSTLFACTFGTSWCGEFQQKREA